MGVISVQEQLALFVGLVYLPACNRVRMPDGTLLDQKFPGRYATDASGDQVSRAWHAFIYNQAYRPPTAQY